MANSSFLQVEAATTVPKQERDTYALMVKDVSDDETALSITVVVGHGEQSETVNLKLLVDDGSVDEQNLHDVNLSELLNNLDLNVPSEIVSWGGILFMYTVPVNIPLSLIQIGRLLLPPGKDVTVVISEDLAQFTVTAVKTDFCDSCSEVTDVKNVSLDVTNVCSPVTIVSSSSSASVFTHIPFVQFRPQTNLGPI